MMEDHVSIRHFFSTQDLLTIVKKYTYQQKVQMVQFTKEFDDLVQSIQKIQLDKKIKNRKNSVFYH